MLLIRLICTSKFSSRQVDKTVHIAHYDVSVAIIEILLCHCCSSNLGCSGGLICQQYVLCMNG